MQPSKVYSHRVEIYTGKKHSFEADRFDVGQAEVLAQNENYIVLNDASFTKLQMKWDKDFNCYPVIQHPSIDVHVKSTIWSDGVVFQLFAYSQWSPEDIERAIKNAITEKCGWMKGKVSFAILKKAASDESVAQ